MAIVERIQKVVCIDGIGWEVVEVQTVTTDSGRKRKRTIGIGYFPTFAAATDFVRFTFGIGAGR